MPKKLTQEEFEQRVLNKLGTDYKVLGQYVNKDTKIEMVHYVCGNTFMKRPHDVMSKGSGCPFCNGSKPALYNEQWVKDNTPLPYHYISGYISMKEKCTFHCDKCNSDFEQSPSRLINQHIYGCNCCPTKKKTNEEFLQELGEECLKEYEVLEEYINIDTKITFKHKPCGTEFKLTPYNFIHQANKKYCPICYYKKSNGEKSITQFLENHHIDYQREFSLPGMGKKKFDFYLPELKTAIEYDGSQHFYPNDFFGGEQAFVETQQRDKEKNQYCLDNNIILYRIPYTELHNINQILYKIFEEKSSTTIEKYLITE